MTDSIFVVKESQEHCFLFDGDDILELLQALTSAAERPESGLCAEEAIEVLEGVIPERLRSI